ncbi:MAG: TolC family protein [Thermodesulfovibrionales bacterium]|nr:TolC family protein [Thermodesulfovibrionales bacterium]
MSFMNFIFCLRFLVFFLISIITLSTVSLARASVEYSLDELYSIALQNSEKIKITEEELVISELIKDKALSALMPKISAFGGYTKFNKENISSAGTVIQPNESLLWGIRVDQTFSLSGREITALNISSKGIEKSKYDLHSTKESYLLTVALAYYDLLKAQKLLDIAQSNVDRLTKHRDAALTRLKIGEVTKTALLRAEAELSGAISDKIKAENKLKLAKSVLATVVGIKEEFTVRESNQENGNYIDQILKNCSLPIQCFTEKAFASRAELRSLELQKKISEEQIKYAKGAYLPTISIEGVWLKKEEDPPSISLIKENIYGAIKLNFPFFEGGLRRAEVKEAESRKKQTEFLYEDTKKSITLEIESAFLDYITLQGILKSLKDQVAFAKDNFNSISKQFQFGLANSIDVMDANTLLITAERQLLDVTYSFEASKIKLLKALGVLYNKKH